MSESLAIPAIHNNGTSKKELVSDLRNAYTALTDSLALLRLTAPHMRDYYTKENNDYKTAREQYQARYSKIEEVMKELESIAITIQIGK